MKQYLTFWEWKIKRKKEKTDFLLGVTEKEERTWP
jgi:hypothetical protein